MDGSEEGAGTHLREWGAIVAIGLAYTALRAWAAPADPTVAVRNALELVAIEERLGFFLERSVQAMAMGHGWLVEAFNLYYVAMHLPPVVAFLLYAYLRHRPAWPLVRNALVVFTALGLVGHVVYPVAPPWFLDGLGIQDTLAGAHQGHPQASTFGNPYAAMPSMHFGWALGAGLGFAWLGRSRWTQALGILHPLLMGIVIVATGNHYVIDAVASGLLLAVSAAVTLALCGTADPRGGAGGPRRRRAPRPICGSDPSLQDRGQARTEP